MPRSTLGLGELDVVVADDLDAVAPGIAKIEEGSVDQGDSGGVERLAGRLLVIDHQAEMAAVVRRLPAALLQGDELVAQIDEGHGVGLAAQVEGEETAVERQRLFDVPDLQCDMVEADGAGLVNSVIWILLRQPEHQVGRASHGRNRSAPCSRKLVEASGDERVSERFGQARVFQNAVCRMS